MTAFVLDASVALSFLLQSRVTAVTDVLLERLFLERATAPQFWAFEVANGILKAGGREGMTPDEVRALLSLLELMVALCEAAPDDSAARERAYALAIDHRLSSYDAAYLALAVERGLPLATLDRPLRAACGRLGVPILPALV